MDYYITQLTQLLICRYLSTINDARKLLKLKKFVLQNRKKKLRDQIDRHEDYYFFFGTLLNYIIHTQKSGWSI